MREFSDSRINILRKQDLLALLAVNNLIDELFYQQKP